jgi:hypothetical protein
VAGGGHAGRDREAVGTASKAEEAVLFWKKEPKNFSQFGAARFTIAQRPN